MKKLIATSLLLSSMNAIAGWNLNNQRDIYDLMYMPKKGNGAILAEYEMQEMKFQYPSGGTTVKETDSQTYMTGKMVMGLSESFALGLKAKYLNEGNIKDESGTTTTEEKSKGIANPSASIRLRIMDQSKGFANFDLFGEYTADLGKRIDATTKKNGNGYDGGSSTAIGAALGKKYTDMAWKIEANLLSHGVAKVEDAEDPTSKYDIKSYKDFSIIGSWQWLFSDSFVLNINVGSGKEDKQEWDFGSNVVITKSALSYSLGGLDLSYLISKDTSLGISFMTKSLDKYDYSVNGALLYTATDMKADSTTFSFKTQF